MLRDTDRGKEFQSELTLETFVNENLKDIFNLSSLKRQYFCNGEVCDILAVDEEGRLVIIELKNQEDRYIVQQLTRYYHSVIQQQPFNSQIDYELPARLLAVAPSFHRHNLIDRIYSKIELELFQFEIITSAEGYCLHIQNIDSLVDKKVLIPYQEPKIQTIENIPEPPRRLLDYVGGYPDSKQQSILRFREKLLLFDSRIKEIITSKSIQYGSGKTRLCAELYFNSKEGELIPFLWIPIYRYFKQRAIGRHRIWTDWEQVLYFGHVTEGLGKRKPDDYWKSVPRDKLPRKVYSMYKFEAQSFHRGIASDLGCENGSTALEALLDVALKSWRAR